MIADKLIELTPIVAVDGEVLTEKKDFTLIKYADKSVDLWLRKQGVKITIKPPDRPTIITPRPVTDPRFYFNDKPVVPQSVFSHIEGHYPGVTIRFVGQPIGMLQLIPRVVDTKYERIKRQKEDWDHYMRKGKFDLDYFNEYGLDGNNEAPGDQEV